MVASAGIILLQCRLRGWQVLIDRFIVVAIFVWSLYRNTKHSQLVPKGFDHFSSCIESNESIKKMLVLTVFCRLLYHIIGALFKNIRTPVWDLLVALSPEWAASTKNVWRPHLHLELERLPVWPPCHLGRSHTNREQQTSARRLSDAEDQIKDFSSSSPWGNWTNRIPVWYVPCKEKIGT